MRRRCFVIGGTSQISSWLVPRLVEQGWEPHILSRGGSRPDYGPFVQWHRLDLTEVSQELPTVDAQVLFHTAQLDLLPNWIDQFHARGLNRVIAFGTTSIFTKADSSSTSERELMAALGRAEKELTDKCTQLAIRFTIFRPTLVYGGHFGDRNLSDAARIISRFGLFPSFGRGDGLRQPVHAADLAEACLLACDRPQTFDRSYNLAGGESLPYRMMIGRIFAELDRKPRFIRLPAWLFSFAVDLIRLHPRFRHVTADMAFRMQQDMVFDYSDAVNDFGYAPRPFEPAIRL